VRRQEGDGERALVSAAKRPTEKDPPWFRRLACSVEFKRRIGEILREWPTDGSDTTDQEMDIDDAYTAWNRRMQELPE